MRFLVIDPDHRLRSRLPFILAEAGHEVVIQAGVTRVGPQLFGARSECVLLDSDIPDEQRNTIIQDLRLHGHGGPILIVAEHEGVLSRPAAVDMDCVNE